MKKLITILIVVGAGTIGCNKEKCYICTTTHLLISTQTAEGYPKTVTGDIIELCDSEEAIKNYEESNQGVYYDVIDGITVIAEYETKCVEK
jgi:hypothetical protein